MTLVWLVAAWLIGIALTAHTVQPQLVWLAIAGSGLFGLFLIRLLRPPARRWRWLFMGVLAFGLGAARQSATHHTVTDADLAYYNDKGSADLTGVIVDAPEIRDTSIHLRVQMDSIKVGKTTKPVAGLALVEADRFGQYAYGDRVTIFGQPQTPPTFDTFSYQDYLAQSDIYTLLLTPKLTITAHDQASPFLAALYAVHARAHDLIGQLLPSPQSAVLSGVLLGIRTDLPPEIRDAFDQTGAARVLVIDGSKMTIISGLLFVLFGRIKDKRLSALLILIGLGTYTLFVGAAPPVLRAATMAGLAIIAARLGRQSDGLTALAFAVWLQTLFDPLLITDAGLLISASSTLGLIVFGEPLTQAVEHALNRVFAAETVKRVIAVLGEIVLVTVAVQLPSLPIMFLIFGQFSPIGLLVNMLITPAQAPLLTLGLLGLVAGAVLFPLGQLLMWLAAIPLSYTLTLVRTAAQVPAASIPTHITPAEAIAYYAILLGVAVLIRLPPEQRRLWIVKMRQSITTPVLGMSGVGIAFLVWAFVLARPDGRLHVWFLSVGAGNAVLIQTPNGAHVLIDGGPDPTRLATALGDRLPFYQRDLDLLIVTQPKTSAIAALTPLLTHYTVHTVLTNGQITAKSAYSLLSDAWAAAGARAIAGTAGYQVQTSDGVTLQILNPQTPPDNTVKPEDAALVLRLTYHDVSFLLTPDLSDVAEQAMRTGGWYLGASVLQVPSHASDAANGADFLKAVAPQIAVIEAEAGNRLGQPSDAVLTRLGNVPIYRTDQQGTVAFTSDGTALWVTTAR